MSTLQKLGDILLAILAMMVGYFPRPDELPGYSKHTDSTSTKLQS